jgi:hypothetical protein
MIWSFLGLMAIEVSSLGSGSAGGLAMISKMEGIASALLKKLLSSTEPANSATTRNVIALIFFIDIASNHLPASEDSSIRPAPAQASKFANFSKRMRTAILGLTSVSENESEKATLSFDRDLRYSHGFARGDAC